MASPATILQHPLRLPSRLNRTTAPRACTLMHCPVLLQQQVDCKRRSKYTLASHPSDALTRQTKAENSTQRGTLSAAPFPANPAAPKLATEQYSSEAFVEGVGAVIYRLATKQICVPHQTTEDWYVLAKGSRDLGETRQVAALRELKEETGHPCRLLLVTISARRPLTMEPEHSPDQVRSFDRASEPSTLQMMRLRQTDLEMVWWYIAAVDDRIPTERRTALEVAKLSVMWCHYSDVLD